jgi:hypothetical protein
MIDTIKESIMPPFLRTLSAVVVLVGCSCNGKTDSNIDIPKPIKQNTSVLLIFHPGNVVNDPRYSISVINDSLIAKSETDECSTKLTQVQLDKINDLVSAIKTPYTKIIGGITDTWGATLIINDRLFYQTNIDRIPSTPEEITDLINYLVSFCHIKFDFYGFA